VLAASTIYVAFKIIEQLKENFPLEEKVIIFNKSSYPVLDKRTPRNSENL
jgi:hypothetical protein